MDLVRKDNQLLHAKLKEISTNYSSTLKLNSNLTNSLNTLSRKQQQQQPLTPPLQNIPTQNGTNSISNNNDFIDHTNHDLLNNGSTNIDQLIYQTPFLSAQNANLLQQNASSTLTKQRMRQFSNSSINATNSISSTKFLNEHVLNKPTNSNQTYMDPVDLIVNHGATSTANLNNMNQNCDWDKLDEAAKVKIIF